MATLQSHATLCSCTFQVLSTVLFNYECTVFRVTSQLTFGTLGTCTSPLCKWSLTSRTAVISFSRLLLHSLGLPGDRGRYQHDPISSGVCDSNSTSASCHLWWDRKSCRFTGFRTQVRTSNDIIAGNGFRSQVRTSHVTQYDCSVVTPPTPY